MGKIATCIWNSYNETMRRKLSRSITKLSVIILIELFLGFIVSVSALLVFLKIALNIKTIQVFDVFVNSLLYQIRTPALNEIMTLASFLGHQVLLVLLGVVIVVLMVKKYYRDAVLFFITLITGTVLNIIVKEVVSRDRPSVDPLFQEILHSFPSLHATNSFVFYSLIVLLIYKLTRNRVYTLVAFVICSVVVLLVGISRMYLGVHYLSDVVAGYIFGLWWVATVLVIDKTISIIRFKNR